ncbi:hypothetical protein CLOM_g21076 [Closterium sp. NIES-68]|nr:hypothetical protein CLOM_g21076 [Closterium sp. NIES-68]GJP85786.1 hypothetical protein CLOP_g15885 [Closterium sp. NIES-67]
MARLLSALILISAFVVGAAAQCATPLQACDFFFKPPRGMKPFVPTFKLRPSNMNLMLSKTSIMHKSGDVVLSASNNNEYNGCIMTPKLDWRTCDKVFLFKGAGTGPMSYVNTNLIAMYPMTADTVPLYKNRCIVLRMDNTRLARTGYLNSGDTRARFPEHRRCIAFKTA